MLTINVSSSRMNDDGTAVSSQMIVELMFSNSPIGGANGQLETVNDSLL